MELEKMIIEWVIKNLNDTDLGTLEITLNNALSLINGLSPWDAEKALKILFGGAEVAE